MSSKLIVIKEYCNCGGYAWSMNGRDPRWPHMDYCPQRSEYAEYRKSIDWPEDYQHDNGQYRSKCAHCGVTFVGHKRRVSCRACQKTC